ncbi:MAG: bifunctional diaminohydroxyphosphoribosylaminopyrimidine deaminase/5-amino-6-(5-phosphoribosylamino)uracil reductase RibD [Candidatus Omnitrophota bacterium]
MARKAEGLVSPNPLVGAVIAKADRVISYGYHRGPGFKHAEIEAIDNARAGLKGGVLYVNLEPCCHWGRTPPCVDRIISSGIKEVVISTLDPNPKVNGRSVRKLKRAGIKVRLGILQGEAERLNEIFFKNMRHNLPFIAVKLAQSLDGKIATKKGESKWITSKTSRYYVRKIRDNYDAVLIGINTVLEDDPLLDGFKKSPRKVVIDPRLRIPLNCQLIKRSRNRVVIFTSVSGKSRKAKKLGQEGVNLFFLKKTSRHMAINDILRVLYKEDIMSVLVEGGAVTAGNFFDAKAVDKLYIFVAPKIIGGQESLSALGGLGIEKLAEATVIDHLRLKRIDQDLLFFGYPKFYD